uniref:hypothetical protein n=1 Tax=Citrobacter portucalensis TaxID=1639133 RepID=UPI00196B4EFF
LPDALRLSGLQNTFSPAPVGRIRRHAASGNVPPRCLMRCAYQAYKIRSVRGFHPAQTQKSPSVRMGFFTLINAWQ